MPEEIGPRRPHRPRGRPAIGKVGRGLRSDCCDDPPPPELLQGIEEFNRREFFQCHETLEALWIQEADPIRYLYQGILQVGVGFYHLLRGNYAGALHLMDKGLALLEPFAPACMGVDVARLIAESRACRTTLLRLGPARIRDFDTTTVPQVRMVFLPKVS